MLRIRDYRKMASLTMKELGDKVGVTESAIGYYETGKRKPDYEMLLKIAEALSCTVNDLLGQAKELPTFEGEQYSPAKQKIVDSLDGLNEDQLNKLLQIIETAKGIM